MADGQLVGRVQKTAIDISRIGGYYHSRGGECEYGVRAGACPKPRATHPIARHAPRHRATALPPSCACRRKSGFARRCRARHSLELLYREDLRLVKTLTHSRLRVAAYDL
jgi:hypothetical protein